MIRYGYLKELTPPAPFVNVSLRNPVSGDVQQNIPAQIDTAADRTVVPESLVETLSLPRMGLITVGGVGGTSQQMAAHLVELSLHDLPAISIKVVTCPGESWVLLGRDVLNAYQMLLNGPQRFVEIG